MLFGHYLEADIVYAFGAPSLTNMSRVDPACDIPAPHRDLSLLLANWNGRTHYKIYYSEGYKRDRLAAERMAGCPGVELCPLPGEEHNMFKNIDPAELLTDLFPPLGEPG